MPATHTTTHKGYMARGHGSAHLLGKKKTKKKNKNEKKNEHNSQTDTQTDPNQANRAHG